MGKQRHSWLSVCEALSYRIAELIYDVDMRAGKMLFLQGVPHCLHVKWAGTNAGRQLKSLTNPSIPTVGTEGNLTLFCSFFIVWFNRLYNVKTAGVHHLAPRCRGPGPTVYDTDYMEFCLWSTWSRLSGWSGRPNNKMSASRWHFWYRIPLKLD
jgi:hypothetical protein